MEKPLITLLFFTWISLPTYAVDLPDNTGPYPVGFTEGRQNVKVVGNPVNPLFTPDVVPTLRVSPVYPARALSMGVEGFVTVEFIISTDGSAKDPVILNAQPARIFDKAVLDAIEKWKFSPISVDGEAAEKQVRQNVRFTLKLAEI